jgi:formate/nitrite transporter FocA (FNT family)
VVLVTNLIGAFLFALAAAHTDIFSPEVKHAFDEMGRRALEGSALTIFARGIFAGWIIALMVWMLPAATGAGFLVIAVMAWLVGAAHLSHIIVGSVEVLYLAATGGTSYGTYLTHFMLPALLGNTLGGVTLVAALNHAQVVAGNAQEKKREDARRKAEQKRRVAVQA